MDRRLLAAQIDLIVLGLLSSGLVWFAGPLTSSPSPMWKPFGAAMAVMCVVEVFSGRTPGKAVARLRVRRRNGAAAPWSAVVLRGVVRLAPVAVFALSLVVRRSPLDITILFGAFAIACCYVSLCYVMFMRVGLTLFDAASGTRVAHVP